MSNTKESGGGKVEWRITMEGNKSEVLRQESSLIKGIGHSLKTLIVKLFVKVWTFLKNAWDLGNADPRKVIHCLKVGVAMTVVSLFYYIRPLYNGVGGTAMWAVMTVVVVFEFTVGAAVCKSLNRIMGTCLAGFLAVGVHWVASKSGDEFEPIIMGVWIFLLASAATFSRFIPVVKARFDYGAMIFVLTFSLVSVSGYRVDKLINMARERLSTIIIGTSLCILTTMLVFPVWAGGELHCLITRNMTKLANSLDCCVAEYLDDGNISRSDSEASSKDLLAYKCILNSKATEESMVNFARWEPPHGRFSYQHPWKQYLKIGTAMRNCAYCLEALNSCINNKNQESKLMNKQFSNICKSLSSSTSSILREIAQNLEKMSKSSRTDFLMEEMNVALQDLETHLRSIPAAFFIPPKDDSETNSPDHDAKQAVLNINYTVVPLDEIIPPITFASLLTEISSRVEDIVGTVQELADMAEFKPAAATTTTTTKTDKQKQDQHSSTDPELSKQERKEKTTNTLETV